MSKDRRDTRQVLNQRVSSDLPYQVGGTKILTEIRHASKPSGTLKRRTIFSIKLLSLYRSRIHEGKSAQTETSGQKQNISVGGRGEEAHSKQAVAARRNADSTGGWWEAKRRLASVFGFILLIGLAGCRNREKP